MKDEKELTEEIYANLVQDKPFNLKKIEKFFNLANRGFKDIWTGWYSRGKTPPNLEVDIINVFEDIRKKIDDALIIATEVKFFKDLKNRGFYEGLGQILSYSIFGFDGLSLWHLFQKDIDGDKIQNFSNATKQVLIGFNLPIFYLCGRLVDEEKLIIQSFAPSVGNMGSLKYFVEWMCKHVGEDNIRNILLFEDKPLDSYAEEIQRRRKTLKVTLKIP